MSERPIYLDNIIFSLQSAGGISSYWAGLLGAWQASNANWHAIEYPRGTNHEREQLSLEAARLTQRNGRFLERLRPVSIPTEDPAVLHSSYYRYSVEPHTRTVLTVFDFIHERHRRDPAARLFGWQKRRALQRAHSIIAISNSTRRDMLALYPEIPPERCCVIHPGIDPVFSQSSGSLAAISSASGRSAEKSARALLANVAADRRVALFLGSRAPYKNFELAVELVGAQRDLHLLIVGGGPLSARHARLLEANVPTRYSLHHGIDNQTLAQLYVRAACLLYPSSYEGFGLPVVEAMAAGCPVLALDTSSVSEIADGKYPLAGSTRDAFAVLDQILHSNAGRESMVRAGLERSKHFSRTHCHTKTLELVRELAGSF